MTKYRAAVDTMIQGKPTAEGAEVALSEDKAKAYLEAGLIEEIKGQKASKVDKDLEEAAKKVDTSTEKRTEK